MSINLRTYFILILSVFVILFTTIISITINNESSQSVEEHINHSLTEKAYQIAEKLDYFMWSRYGEITILSNLETLKHPKDEEEITNLLNELKLNFPYYSWIGYTDTSGNIKAATDDILVGVDISERPVFKEAVEETFIGDVHEAVLLAKLLPNPTGEPVKFVDISAPVFNEENEFIGVLASHLSWRWAEEVRESVILPLKHKEETLDVFIVSKLDNTILLGPKDMIGQPLEINAVKKAQLGRNEWSLEKWPDGNNYLTGYSLADGFLNYPGLDWTVLVRQPEQVAFHSVDRLRDNIMKIGLFSAILFGIIGWYFAGIISNPLRQLALAANQLRNGEKVEIPIKKGIRDIELLAISLRELISTLTRTESNLGRMEVIAHQDALTALPNRYALDEYIKKLNPSLQKDTTNHAVLYLDLDGFKNVNDELSHHHGDIALKEVANRLKKCIPSKDLICRLGGDEFVIILEVDPNNSFETIDKIGNRIIESLNKPMNIEGCTVTIGCSIGSAIWPAHDEDLYQVLRYADKALYLSKAQGKNQLTYYKR